MRCRNGESFTRHGHEEKFGEIQTWQGGRWIFKRISRGPTCLEKKMASGEIKNLDRKKRQTEMQGMMGRKEPMQPLIRHRGGGAGKSDRKKQTRPLDSLGKRERAVR